MDKIVLQEKFDQISTYWDPHIIGSLNNQLVKIAKVKGTFTWHSHAEEDELFFVVKGCLHIELRETTVELSPGELYIVPKGVEHRPSAPEETWIMLFEPVSTVNTGTIHNNFTKTNLKKL